MSPASRAAPAAATGEIQFHTCECLHVFKKKAAAVVTFGNEDASRCLVSASEILFFCVTPSLSYCVMGAHVCVNSISPGFLELTTPRVYKTLKIQEIEQVEGNGSEGRMVFPLMCSNTFSSEK